MSNPGSGRYTNYIPIPPKNDPGGAAAKRYKRLAELFNGKAGDAGVIYGDAYQTDPVAAAAAAVAMATATGGKGLFPSNGIQAGDATMFPKDVNLGFGGAPNLEEAAPWKAGGPMNPYVPDVSSPGPGKTEGTDKDDKIEIKPEELKPGYVVGNNNGTVSPSTSSPTLGAPPIGVALKMGESQYSKK